MRPATGTLALTLLAGAALAACQQASPSQPPASALPLDTASAAPLTDAPAAAALPAAPPAPVGNVSGPDQSYAYADQAWAMSDAFGDSPPDYAFDDDGVTPWVWTAGNNAICVAEAVPGGERYYYYQPGADQPFYVQGPDYGYAFEGGALVGVYDHSGQSVPVASHAELAGRYLARAETLRRGATSAPHQAVAASNWNAQRKYVAAQRTTFSSEAAANPGLSAYHAQHAAQEQAQWAPEAAKRETWAATTDARLGNQADADRERSLARAVRTTPAAPAPDHAPPAAAPPRDRAPPPAAQPPRPSPPAPRAEARAPARPPPEASHRSPVVSEHRAPERAAAPAHAPARASAHPPAKPAERARTPDDKRP